MNWLKKLLNPANIISLPSEQWDNGIKNDAKSEILNVRTPGEFSQGSIPKSKNMDVMSSSFVQGITKLDPNKSYYVYCRSGARSKMACKRLKKQGIENVFNLSGGIMNYKGKVS